MTRSLSLAFLVVSATVAAGGMPFTFPGAPTRSRKPNPAVVALRDYAATLHTNLGNLQVRFYPDEAPNAVRNFIQLAQRGYYDGSRFCTVFPGKMVLAGDPTGTGAGDNGKTLAFERSSTPNLAGSLAMDRTAAQDAKTNSGSRFMISLTDQRHLDGDYTVFGAITDGLDVARRIGAARAQPNQGRPTPIEEMVIERVTVTKPLPPKPEKSGD